MKCEEFRQALVEDLEFESTQREEAAAHAADCAACRALASAARQLRDDLALERELVTQGPASGADEGDAPARRFDLLLAAWRSGAADAGGEPRGRVPAPIAASARWRRVAAALLWFAVGAGLGGFAVARWHSRPEPKPPAEPVDDAPRFFLALLESTSSAPPPRPGPISAESQKRIVGEYTAWAQSMHDRGLLVDADRLSDESFAYLRLRAGRIVVADEPEADASSHLGGFFLVRARDLDAAIELARSSPHLKYGGEIEIRAVVRAPQEK